MKPFLSIIIANYNNGHLLNDCVASILQDAPMDEIEIIIIDDKSTDCSVNVIKKIATHPAVRYACHEKNGGVEAAVHTGVQLAGGSYVHLFAADDLYLPNSTQIMIQRMKEHPHVVCFSSDYASFFPAAPKKIVCKKLLPLSEFTYFTPQDIFHLFQRTKFWIPGHTVFLKKEIFLQYAPQDKRLGSISDWYINHKIALDYGVGYFPSPLIARREDVNCTSSQNALRMRKKMWLHLLTLFEKEPHDKLIRSGICRMLGLKAIYFELLTTPRYWKVLIPMLRKALYNKELPCGSCFVRD